MPAPAGTGPVPAPADDQTSTALVVARAWNQGFNALAVRVTGAGLANGRYRGEPGAGLGTGADAPLGVEAVRVGMRPGCTWESGNFAEPMRFFVGILRIRENRQD